MLALLDEVERLRGMLAGLVMSRDAMQGAEIMELSLSARRDEREKIAVWLESGHASYPVLDDGRRLTLGAEIQRRTCESCAAEIRNGKASEKP